MAKARHRPIAAGTATRAMLNPRLGVMSGSSKPIISPIPPPRSFQRRRGADSRPQTSRRFCESVSGVPVLLIDL
eukprot:scaffold23628_cov100-Isochrysis_galbana.AAC.1